MKNKNEVYVVVDTPKKAKKLKRLLDMFGEMYGDSTFNLVKQKSISQIFFNAYQCEVDCMGCIDEGEYSKISIKELKNILAKEHLKPGDYFVDCNKYVFVINKLNDDETIDCSCLTHNTKGDLSYEDFKRYATPEEIALLEPKPKELEVGKWYKVGKLRNGCLGFDSLGQIVDVVDKEDVKNGLSKYDKDILYIRNVKGVVWRINNDADFTEATPQEVEESLIKEAKKRGFVIGAKTFAFGNATEISICLDTFFLSECLTELRVGVDDKFFTQRLIFKNGKWAEVIKNDDKFAELKEAHKNGAVIECLQSYGEWFEIENPQWDEYSEYRIKPEEKPKVGDVVRADYGDDFSIKILIPSDLSSPLFKYTKLTQQEAIDLLFKK